MNVDTSKKTSIHNVHLELGARMLPYGGFIMPINYSKGIQAEYDSVRKNVGMFDVSHMGQIVVSGNDALDYLQYITINDVSLINEGEAQYNAICNDLGGIKDDVIIYNIKNKYILIVNASNYNKISKWMVDRNDFDCKISLESEKFSLIALQGPKSRKILEKLIRKKNKLKFYKHEKIEINNSEVLISRTGYTGELGFEILSDNDNILKIWNDLLNLGVEPCGLAVRDVLRMEMKYCLYGNDINENITPLEAVLNWIVKFSKGKFIGKNALLKQKENGLSKKMIAFEMTDKCIPRKGYKIYSKNLHIGEVTSGTFSLGIKKGIGLGYVFIDYLNFTDDFYIEVRNKKKYCKLNTSSFIKSTSIYD